MKSFLLLFVLFVLRLSGQEPPSLYAPPEDPEAVMRLDPVTREYFARFVKPRDSTLGMASALVGAVLDKDKLGFEYQWDGVYDVNETFRRRKGNCVTFSLLLAALFKEFGLDAKVNHVTDFRPQWAKVGSFLAEVDHVNLSIEDYYDSYVVDFFRIAGIEDFPDKVEPLTRRQFVSMFYSNFGVYAYGAGRADAYHWLRKAVEVDENYLSLSNLGTAFLCDHRPGEALGFLRQARRHGADARLYSLMASAERQLGHEEAALKLEKTGHRYLEENPYYHYRQAKEYYQAGDRERALEAINKAVQRSENPLFEEFRRQVRQMPRGR